MVLTVEDRKSSPAPKGNSTAWTFSNNRTRASSRARAGNPQRCAGFKNRAITTSPVFIPARRRRSQLHPDFDSSPTHAAPSCRRPRPSALASSDRLLCGAMPIPSHLSSLPFPLSLPHLRTRAELPSPSSAPWRLKSVTIEKLPSSPSSPRAAPELPVGQLELLPSFSAASSCSQLGQPPLLSNVLAPKLPILISLSRSLTTFSLSSSHPFNGAGLAPKRRVEGVPREHGSVRPSPSRPPLPAQALDQVKVGLNSTLEAVQFLSPRRPPTSRAFVLIYTAAVHYTMLFCGPPRRTSDLATVPAPCLP